MSRDLPGYDSKSGGIDLSRARKEDRGCHRCSRRVVHISGVGTNSCTGIFESYAANLIQERDEADLPLKLVTPSLEVL
jgi:hypothetical protein